MKIALLADSFLPDPKSGINGTQVQLYQLAHAFARRGHSVSYIYAARDRSTHWPGEGDLDLYFYPEHHHVFGWIPAMRRAAQLLRKIAPDAVYQRGRSPLTLVAAKWSRRSGKPFVWGSNGEDSGEYFKYLDRLRKSQRAGIARMLLGPDAWLRDLCIHRGIVGATNIVAQTEHQKMRIKANFGKDSIVLASYFFPPDKRKDKQSRTTILWLASMTRNKQPELFLDLARKFMDKDDWRFCLAGGTADEAYKTEIAERSAGLSNLDMPGPIPFSDSDDKYLRATVSVNTSLVEGLPNAYIQSWFNGTPVLSLHQDPNNWIAKHGLGHCSHGDMNDMHITLRLWLEEPALLEEMRSRCRNFAQERFSDERVIDTYLHLLSLRGSRSNTPDFTDT